MHAGRSVAVRHPHRCMLLCRLLVSYTHTHTSSSRGHTPCMPDLTLGQEVHDALVDVGHPLRLLCGGRRKHCKRLLWRNHLPSILPGCKRINDNPLPNHFLLPHPHSCCAASHLRPSLSKDCNFTSSSGNTCCLLY